MLCYLVAGAELVALVTIGGLVRGYLDLRQLVREIQELEKRASEKTSD
jgi:hypothetical protein